MKILHIITDINTGGAITLLKKITSKNIDHNIKHVIISLKEASPCIKNFVYLKFLILIKYIHSILNLKYFFF